jgi:hypothetical protein
MNRIWSECRQQFNCSRQPLRVNPNRGRKKRAATRSRPESAKDLQPPGMLHVKRQSRSLKLFPVLPARFRLILRAGNRI